MTRVSVIALAVACVAFAPQAMAQYGTTRPWLTVPTGPAQSSSVKSSKSNTSDRIGGTHGRGANTRATTVKSSKSNTSDRIGPTLGTGANTRATTVKSSNSNTI